MAALCGAADANISRRTTTIQLSVVLSALPTCCSWSSVVTRPQLQPACARVFTVSELPDLVPMKGIIMTFVFRLPQTSAGNVVPPATAIPPKIFPSARAPTVQINNPALSRGGHRTRNWRSLTLFCTDLDAFSSRVE